MIEIVLISILVIIIIAIINSTHSFYGKNNNPKIHLDSPRIVHELLPENYAMLRENPRFDPLSPSPRIRLDDSCTDERKTPWGNSLPPISKRTRSPRTTSGFSGRALKRGASGKLDSTRESRAILILEIESVARWKSSTDVTISRRRLEESERGTRVTDARVQREFIPRRVPNCDPSTPRDTRGSPYFNFSTDSNPKNAEGFRKFGLKKQNLFRFKRQLKKQLELKKQNL